MAALRSPGRGRLTEEVRLCMMREGEVIPWIIRSRSSYPSQTSPTQPDPVLNIVIVLKMCYNPIKKSLKKEYKKHR